MCVCACVRACVYVCVCVCMCEGWSGRWDRRKKGERHRQMDNEPVQRTSFESRPDPTDNTQRRRQSQRCDESEERRMCVSRERCTAETAAAKGETEGKAAIRTMCAALCLSSPLNHCPVRNGNASSFLSSVRYKGLGCALLRRCIAPCCSATAAARHCTGRPAQLPYAARPGSGQRLPGASRQLD